MRTLVRWALVFIVFQSLYAENSISIVGDLDDGYYFNEVITLSLTFDNDGRIQHAYQEITYRDARNRTEPLYEITIDRDGDTYTAYGYFNNRAGELRNFLTAEYTFNAEKHSYTVVYPDRENMPDVTLLTKDENSYGRMVEGEWPEVLSIYSDQITFTDEKQDELIVLLDLDDNQRVIALHNKYRLVATATPLENSIEIHEIPIEGSATEYEIIIGEDYVPPQELHIRAFNVFITSLAGHAVYFPFLVGYF